jgi:L-alanine-DL-glutamate epimerase-like enolase superfamily enzyme
VKITSVHVDTLELLYDEPFVIASSALSAGACDLITLETDEGLVGHGEACPAYEFTGETLWTVQDVIGEYLGPAVLGRDPFDVEAIVHSWEHELWTVGNEAARAGLEMALWDLQGKATGRPLCELLGGRVRDALPEVGGLGWDEPEALAARVRLLSAEGVTVFKVKVGDAPARDEARVAAVRAAAGPHARLTVDANQGWRDAATALRAIRLLEPYDIEFVEQPVRMGDLEAARQVRERSGLPVALDESVRGPAEALAAVRAGACDLIVVKLMKTGGILNALKVNAIAEAAGVSVMLGNMGESSFGLAAHFHVAAALANATHADADVNARPGGLRRDIGRGLGVEVRDGASMVTLPDAPGIGVELDDIAVAAQRVVRRW